MKIAIIGSGAMGCLYGAYLMKEHDVYFVDAYEPQVNALNHSGLEMIENNVSHRYKSKAYLSGSNLEPMDLVIVFVKSNYTYEAIEMNLSLIDEQTIVVTLQNGAGNDRDIMHFVNSSNVVIGTSKHNSVTITLGKINHTASGMTSLGGNCDKTLQKVYLTFQHCGIDTEIADDIQRIIWSKLFVNISINTLTALLQTNIGYMASDKYAWDFAKKIVYEAVNVAEEDGTYFDRKSVLEMVKSVCIKAGDGYSSMYQDRKKGLATEIDKLNGAIVEQAKLYGVPTPYNSIVVDLIHAAEGTTLNENINPPAMLGRIE